MAHKYSEQMEAINDSLQSTQDLLSSFDIPELNAIKMRISNNLKKEQYFLNSLLGTNNVAATSSPIEIKPLTHMFGKPLQVNADKPVSKAATQPSASEKEKFIAEVQDWYKNFLTLDDEAVLNKINQLVLRGVAKMAGYADAETGEINSEYIGAVKAAITAKNAQQDIIDTSKDKVSAEITSAATQPSASDPKPKK